jgi:hypothetical protein
MAEKLTMGMKGLLSQEGMKDLSLVLSPVQVGLKGVALKAVGMNSLAWV